MQTQSSNLGTSSNWYTAEHEARRRNLQSYASIIADEQVSLFLKVGTQPLDRSTGIGFTCTDNNGSKPRNLIFICHQIDTDANKNLIMQRAVTLHEVGHVKWTDGRQWICASTKHSIKIPHDVMNIIEDGRVEIGLCMEYPIARSYLIYTNSKLVFPLGAQKITGPESLKYWMLYHAKKAVGGALPLMDESYIDKIFGDNKAKAQELIEKAVIAKTEDMAIEYTAELCKLLGSETTANPSISSGASKADFDKSRPSTQVQPMPSKEDFRKVTEEIEKPKMDSGANGAGSKNSQKKEKAKEGSSKSKDKTEELVKAIAKQLEEEAKQAVQAEVSESIGAEFSDMGELEIVGQDIPLDTSHTQRIIRVLKSLAGEGQEVARNQRRGLLDSSKLGKIQHTDKLFKKINTKEKKELAVTLLVDVSGSMGSPSGGSACARKSETATRLAYAMATGLEMAHFQSEVLAFDDKVYPIKTFSEKMRMAKSKFKAYANSNTLIAQAVSYGAARLAKVNHGTNRRIMFIITDGMDHQPNKTITEIKKAHKSGIVAIGILVGTAEDRNFIFDKKIVVDSMIEAENALITELSKLISRRM